VGAFPLWRPNLDELDVDSAPASAFLILKSTKIIPSFLILKPFKIIPLQLSCRVPARVLVCLLSDGPAECTTILFLLCQISSAQKEVNFRKRM
jgi:hypothetical protein